MENAFPFPRLGMDSDNGPSRSTAETDSRHAARRASKASQFLNRHLLTLRRDRIGQKNRTHVRELLGGDRLDAPALFPLLTELHTVWSDFHNFFLPTLKLLKKERVASKLRKNHEIQACRPAPGSSKTGTSPALPASTAAACFLT